MDKPKISVIIPVLNGERFIAEAIQSVFDQNWEPLEIIVIDDGSSDKTDEVVKNIQGNLHYYYQPNRGIACARNHGVKKANGDLITFIDADDVWVKDKLEIQTNLMNKNPDVEVIIGLLLLTPILSKDELYRMDLAKKKGAFATQLGSSLIKKHVFEKVGMFDEQMLMSEDVDWFYRLREQNINVMVHKEIVEFYRLHDQNITNDKPLTNFYILKAYKQSLDRRRKSGMKVIQPLPKLNNFDEVLRHWQSKL